jgi:hypothetical protein
MIGIVFSVMDGTVSLLPSPLQTPVHLEKKKGIKQQF